MMKFLLMAFLITSLSIFGKENTVIEGVHPEYAGDKIKFYSFFDPISRKQIHLFDIELDASGKFRIEVSFDEPQSVFCEFDVYRGYLILKPGETIKIILPPKRERAFHETKNPYFQPIEFWFSTDKGDQLNDQVQQFELALNEITDHYFNQLYFSRSLVALDSVINNLEIQFKDYSDPLFKLHKKLKISLLKLDVSDNFIKNISSVLEETYSSYKVTPAYIELFEKTFTNKFTIGVDIETRENIKRAITTRDIKYLSSFVERSYELKEPLLSLALLKMMHDAYYSGEFYNDMLIKMVEMPRFSAHACSMIRSTATLTAEKMQFLIRGSSAPVVCLKDIDGKNFCSDKSTGDGKFKYLIFADTEMVVCKEHLKYLQFINDKFGDYLELIVILRKTDLIEMKMFLTKQNIPGIKLIDEDNSFAELYRIRSYPSCFLLTPDHKIAFTDVKAPLDGFEIEFAPFLQKSLMMNRGNQDR